MAFNLSNLQLSNFQNHLPSLLALNSHFHKPIKSLKPLKSPILKHQIITNSINSVLPTGVIFLAIITLLIQNPTLLPYLALTLISLLIFLSLSTRVNSTHSLRLIASKKSMNSLQHQSNQPSPRLVNRVKLTYLVLFHAFCITLFLIPPTSVNAQATPNLGNPTYKFKFVNSGSSSDSTSSGTISNTTPPVKQPSLKALLPFSFTISDISIDFGLLSPNTFSTQTNTLSVSAGNADGYSVSVIQDHPLELSTISTNIPNITAGTWTNPEIYGFGYSINPPYFKPFADQSLDQSPETIMTSSITNSSSTINLTYQANISATQSSGNYQNKVIFLALPTY